MGLLGSKTLTHSLLWSILQQQILQPLVPLVDEFAARLFGELDYVMEGKNCEKFQVGTSHSKLRTA